MNDSTAGSGSASREIPIPESGTLEISLEGTGGAGGGMSGSSATASPKQSGLVSSVVEPPFVGHMNARRRAIKAIAAQVWELRGEVVAAQHFAGDGVPKIQNTSECIANLVLAYRHLEDASMRIGKAIQAADGGVSVYDRDTTVGA